MRKGGREGGRGIEYKNRDCKKEVGESSKHTRTLKHSLSHCHLLH